MVQPALSMNAADQDLEASVKMKLSSEPRRKRDGADVRRRLAYMLQHCGDCFDIVLVDMPLEWVSPLTICKNL